MDRHMAQRDAALVVLGLALIFLAHSWVSILDSTGRAPGVAVSSVLVISQKGESPGTVGQRYQGPKHYKNHDYYTTDYKSLQGGAQHE